MHDPVRLGVLASGRGSNLAALFAARDRGDLVVDFAVVLSNNSGAGALAVARSRGIPALHVSSRTHADEGAAILAALQAHDVDVIVNAGYMKKLDPRVVAAYRGRALNIHPAPLPRFGGQGMYGERVHQAVLAAGVPESGPTVHLVTDEYDAGEVLAHSAVVVQPDDTVESLAQRVLAAEHALYWRVIRDRFCRKP